MSFVSIPAYDRTFDVAQRAWGDPSSNIPLWFVDLFALAAGTHLQGGLFDSEIQDNVIEVIAGLYARYVINASYGGEFPVLANLKGSVDGVSSLENFVGWSKIGDIRFVQDQVNDSGYRPLPLRGKVLNVLPLGKNFVAYSETGIVMFNPTMPSIHIHIPTTFGMKVLANTGIPNKQACIEAVPGLHFFVDCKGYLWKLTEQEGPKNLGYKEFFMDGIHEGKPWVMSFDPYTERLYICNGEIGYIYTGNGLGGGPPDLTSFTVDEGNWVRAYSPRGLPQTPKPVLVTDILDFKLRTPKTIKMIQLGFAAPQHWYVQLDYRWDTTAPWSTTKWVGATKKGQASFNQSGIEFRIRVQAREYVYEELDNILITYEVTSTDAKYLQRLGGGTNQ